MENLERKIKHAYNSKKLSSNQMESIQNVSPVIYKKRAQIFSLLKYAAIFLVILSGIYSVYLLPSQQQNKILNQFATEIAFNHNKNLPPEIKTNSISEINKKLNRLNFKITLPKKITDHYKLIGGRYCSVNNRIAAQLKLESTDLKIVTCYIFKKEESFDFNTLKNENNTQVLLWDSNDLIYAIASDKK